MINIQIPHTYSQERRYIMSVMFHEFLGVEYQLQPENQSDIRITAGNNKELLVVDKLFAKPEDQWLKSSSLPVQPLEVWDLNKAPLNAKTLSKRIPVIYGDNSYVTDFFQSSENQIRLGLDIFGSVFFMLTRYEEMVKPDRDNHNRFPANASLAYQEGFFERPIVNEYLEILWDCLKRLWPNIERKERVFTIMPSHDVDEPYKYAFKSFKWLSGIMAADVIRRRKLNLAIYQAKVWAQVKSGCDQADPFYNFDWIMDQSEKAGMKSAFYFIPDHCGEFDPDYSLDNERIRKLLRRIHERGHEIGYHGSYASCWSAQRTKYEFERLIEVCETLEIKRDVWGCRQHYLRWDVKHTWKNLDMAGLNYDTTLGFAECAGFRSGICFEFPVFDLTTRETLTLIERPLIVMDVSLFSDQYMGLDHVTGLEKISILKDRVREYQGIFEILWHNSWFNGDENGYRFYTNIIEK